MNIERADYGTIVTFGTLEDLNTKLKIENKKLEEIKDSIDDNGISLLEHCLISRKFDIANEILNLKPKINVVTKEGLNEFHCISANMKTLNAYDIAYKLLDMGVSLLQQEKKYGNTALFSFCYNINDKIDDIRLEFLKVCINRLTQRELDIKNKAGNSVKSIIIERGPNELKQLIKSLKL